MPVDERNRILTPRRVDPCPWCGEAGVFVMAHDAPWPSGAEIEASAVLLKTCVIAPRWRWCYRQQRLLGSLRNHLDERFVPL